MKYFYTLFYVASLGMNFYVWHSMVEERTQIAVALDARQLEADETHGDYLRMIEQSKEFNKNLEKAQSIDDHINDLYNETLLLQKVHQEFKDAWLNAGNRK